MITICADNRGTWKVHGLMDYNQYSDCVEYVDQEEYGDGQLQGSWYYIDYGRSVIYYGTFGNYNSPGADSFTFAAIFTPEERKEFLKNAIMWEEREEYLEEELEPTPLEDKDDISIDVLPESPFSDEQEGE